MKTNRVLHKVQLLLRMRNEKNNFQSQVSSKKRLIKKKIIVKKWSDKTRKKEGKKLSDFTHQYNIQIVIFFKDH